MYIFSLFFYVFTHALFMCIKNKITCIELDE